jgi:hypothetical protein
VYRVSRETLHEVMGAKPGEVYIGCYTGINPQIFISEDAFRNSKNGFDTLIHELGEYILSEYSVELSHEQLSVFTKVLAEIMMENKSKFRKLLT